MSTLRILKNGIPHSEIEITPGKEYVAGRGEQCDLLLDQEGISRQHFKIYRDDSGWVLEKLSKFGTVYQNGSLVDQIRLQDGEVFSVPPFTFSFFEHLSVETPLEASASPPALELGDSENEARVNEQAEATSTEASRALPFITISPGHPNEEILKLEGVAWIAGRDESCDIQLEDRKLSRRHFKIMKDRADFYILDLKSSNGTYVNGTQLDSQPRLLESGDEINIGDLSILFEVKDPLISAELDRLPAIVDPQPPAEVGHVMYLPIQLNPESQNDSPNSPHAVRLENLAGGQNDKAAKAKKFQFGIVLVLIIGVGLYFMTDKKAGQTTNSSKCKPNEPGCKQKGDPFLQLSPSEQEFVRRTYKLSRELLMQTKYELALAEVRKVHAVVPEFLDSKEIETTCESSLQTLKNLKDEEVFKKKKEEAEANAKKVIADCNLKFKNSDDADGAEACLAPAMEINPEDPEARQLVEKIQALINQRETSKINKAEFKRLAKKRESIHQKAERLFEKGKLVAALEVYERHIASQLPDPKHLENDSKKKRQSIKDDIQKTLSSAVQEAEGHMANAEYREAVLKLDKALEYDPTNAKAREIYDKAEKELQKKMKVLFSDAVVEESLGNIETAKSKWRKIVAEDIPRGTYRAKAAIKLKKYGGE